MIQYGSTSPDADLVVVYGNCQAAVVAALLASADTGERGYLCVLNHPQPDKPMRLPSAAQMARCRLYIEQYTSDRDPPLRNALRSALPHRCPTLVFPSLWMISPWPFEAMQPAERRDADADFPYGRFPIGDRIALAVAETGLAGDAAYDAYMKLAAERMPNLEQLLELDLDVGVRNDRASDVVIGDYVLEHFRRRHLFRCSGHVTLDAMGLLVERISHAIRPVIGVDPSTGLPRMRATIETLPGMGNVQMPIHPQVAEALELEFYQPDMRYDWMGQSWTHRDYIIRYIEHDRSWPPEGG